MTLKEKIMISCDGNEQEAIQVLVDLGFTDVETQNQRIELVGYCDDGGQRAEVWHCSLSEGYYYINAHAGDVVEELLDLDDLEGFSPLDEELDA